MTVLVVLVVVLAMLAVIGLSMSLRIVQQ